MATWNVVLNHFKEAHDPDQQQEDVEAVFWVPEAESSSNDRKGRKPLQADWCLCDGPELNWREGKDRAGEEE